MNSVSSEAALFERWAQRNGYRRHKDDFGGYLYSETRGAWGGWSGCLNTLEELITALDIHLFVINGRSERFVSVKDLSDILNRGGK